MEMALSSCGSRAASGFLSGTSGHGGAFRLPASHFTQGKLRNLNQYVPALKYLYE